MAERLSAEELLKIRQRYPPEWKPGDVGLYESSAFDVVRVYNHALALESEISHLSYTNSQMAAIIEKDQARLAAAERLSELVGRYLDGQFGAIRLADLRHLNNAFRAA